MPTDVRRVIKRFQQAEQVFEDWRPIHEDCYAYCLPQRNTFRNENSQQGEKRVDRMFDSTGQSSLMRFASRIHSELMPPFQKWVELRAGPLVPEDMRNDINAQLEDINQKLFAVLQSSNFDVACPEMLLDLGIGSGVMMVEKGPDHDNLVKFTTVPLANAMLEESPDGQVVGVYRKWKAIEIRFIELKWPDAAIPAALAKKAADEETAKTDLIEATYMDTKTQAWTYCVIYRESSAKANGEVLVDRPMSGNPWLTPRWMKAPGEVYGRGPAMIALPDIKTQNKIVEFVLKNAALNIAGVYTGVDDGVLNPNTVAIVPGAVIPVRSNGGTRGPSLLPLRNPGEIQFAEVEMEKLTMRIQQVLLDTRLPPEAGPVRSATEIVERIRQLAGDQGSPFGRLMREFVTPMVKRVLMIMQESGLIKPVKVNGLTVTAQIISPLAQQQNINEVQAVVQGMQTLFAISPEIAMLSAKIEELGPWILEKVGTPAKFIRTKTEREGLQKMAGAIAVQQAQAQQKPAGVQQDGGGSPVPLAKAA